MASLLHFTSSLGLVCDKWYEWLTKCQERKHSYISFPYQIVKYICTPSKFKFLSFNEQRVIASLTYCETQQWTKQNSPKQSWFVFLQSTDDGVFTCHVYCPQRHSPRQSWCKSPLSVKEAVLCPRSASSHVHSQAAQSSWAERRWNNIFISDILKSVQNYNTVWYKYFFRVAVINQLIVKWREHFWNGTGSKNLLLFFYGRQLYYFIWMTSLSFGLLVWQNKTLEDFALNSGKCWYIVSTFYFAAIIVC